MDDPVLDSVAKSAAFIASVARDVTIDDEALAKVRLTLAQRIGEHGKWSEHPLNPKTRDESTLSWIFLVDTLNFSFWTPSNMQPFVCEGHSGYWSLCAALNRALREGVEMTSAAVMASLSRAQLAHVFRGDGGEPPMLDERLAVLNEAGKVLIEKYEGKASVLVKRANGSAVAVLRMLASDFSSYRDGRVFAGKFVWFLKRAQIFVADVWAAFEGEGLGRFDDIDSLTMFADYRVPQQLCALGVLRYSERLRKILENESKELTPDLEAEIRGCSIEAVERLRVPGVNAIQIDFWLWDEAKARTDIAHIPIHKLRTIFY